MGVAGGVNISRLTLDAQVRGQHKQEEVAAMDMNTVGKKYRCLFLLLVPIIYIYPERLQ